MLIIIVDDNTLVRKTIREFIEEKSDDIYKFSSGEEVISFLREKKINPDWILLDIKMNGINGFDTAEQIKMINAEWKISFFNKLQYTCI